MNESLKAVIKTAEVDGKTILYVVGKPAGDEVTRIKDTEIAYVRTLFNDETGELTRPVENTEDVPDIFLMLFGPPMAPVTVEHVQLLAEQAGAQDWITVPFNPVLAAEKHPEFADHIVGADLGWTDVAEYQPVADAVNAVTGDTVTVEARCWMVRDEQFEDDLFRQHAQEWIKPIVMEYLDAEVANLEALTNSSQPQPPEIPDEALRKLFGLN